MKHTLIALLGLTGLWLPRVAPVDACNLPPGDALSTDVCDGCSHDAAYSWCEQTLFDSLWSGLHIEGDDWTNGYGVIEDGGSYNVPCDVDSFIGKLLVAGVIVRRVERHAISFGEHRAVFGMGGDWDKYDHGHWWSFTAQFQNEEWEPACSWDASATNYDFGDERIDLKVPGAYNTIAVIRAGILPHEVTHEETGHISDDLCIAQASCDDKYSMLNANTMSVNFYADLTSTYEMDLTSNTPKRLIQRVAGNCKLIPSFAEDEREAARVKIVNMLDERFALPEPAGTPRFPSVPAIDVAHSASWACEDCQLSKHTFEPQLCHQTACNESLNVANQQRNQENRNTCQKYSAAVAADPSLSGIASAKQAYDAALTSCLQPAEASAKAYCDSERASADHADQVDECGWLDAISFPTVSKSRCIKKFCKDQFATTGGWTAADDPVACFAELCSETCSDGVSPAQCRETFVSAHGDDRYYMTPCEMNYCKRGLVECLSGPAGVSWTYPDEPPATCQGEYTQCLKMAGLMATVLAEYAPLAGPGPVELGSVERGHNPGQDLRTHLNAIHAVVARGGPEQSIQSLAVEMTSQRELVAALYAAVPGEFVRLFGRTGFESIVGPTVTTRPPLDFHPRLLSTQGKAVLRQLVTAARGKDPVVGAIGQFR